MIDGSLSTLCKHTTSYTVYNALSSDEIKTILFTGGFLDGISISFSVVKQLSVSLYEIVIECRLLGRISIFSAELLQIYKEERWSVLTVLTSSEQYDLLGGVFLNRYYPQHAKLTPRLFGFPSILAMSRRMRLPDTASISLMYLNRFVLLRRSLHRIRPLKLLLIAITGIISMCFRNQSTILLIGLATIIFLPMRQVSVCAVSALIRNCGHHEVMT